MIREGKQSSRQGWLKKMILKLYKISLKVIGISLEYSYINLKTLVKKKKKIKWACNNNFNVHNFRMNVR